MIHHITAICSDADATADFYTQVLGLRLVKVTVNQDDVGTHHIYFGDRTGKPGTVLTFFPWRHLPQGRAGPGMVSSIAFAVPELEYWEKRLGEKGIEVSKGLRFGEANLAFKDPDGLRLELVASGEPGNWRSDIPAEFAISGFYGATLMLDSYEQTAQLLMEDFGYSLALNDGKWFRFISPSTVIDLHEAPDAPAGVSGTGAVHHIAFRADDIETQEIIRERLVRKGYDPTPPIDRYYFSSVYFRERGGVLFEIATDGPGFMVDEPEESLGQKLVLPPFLEYQRDEIESRLPPFRLNRSGRQPGEAPAL